jgi:hypothetical protein
VLLGKVHGVEGLIQNQQAAQIMLRKGTRQHHALLFTTGERSERAIQQVAHSQRIDGIYPTASTSLDGASDGGQAFAEGAAQPFWPVVLFFAAPVRMVGGNPPGSVHQQPRAWFHLIPVTADGQPVWDRATWDWVERPPLQ